MTESKVLTLNRGNFATLNSLVLEREVELLGLGLGEARHEDSGVGEEDAVHGQTGSLDRVLVHFVSFLSIIIKLNYYFRFCFATLMMMFCYNKWTPSRLIKS